ncbi:MAG: sulfite exporter TauE/SafE family protein [Ruminococcaceae bacterium]|nr:sulfite exporter TauE/SafE family protein [Oscillospiraceae bacterium]
MKIKKFELILIVAGGVGAGFVNGMLGTGGGIVLVFLFGHLLTDRRGYSPRDVFATVILSVIPMSCVSAFMYYKGGNAVLSEADVYIIPGVIGGIMGAFLLDKINLKILKKMFAVMVIYAGVKFFF